MSACGIISMLICKWIIFICRCSFSCCCSCCCRCRCCCRRFISSWRGWEILDILNSCQYCSDRLTSIQTTGAFDRIDSHNLWFCPCYLNRLKRCRCCCLWQIVGLCCGGGYCGFSIFLFIVKIIIRCCIRRIALLSMLNMGLW